MDSNSRIEQLKQRHADLLEQLRGLYEENPELEADAPDGMPELLSKETEAEYEVPDPPEPDAMSETDAVDHLEPADSAEPEGEPDRPVTPRDRVHTREARKAHARKSRLHERGLGPEPLPPPRAPREAEDEPLDLDDAEVAGVRDPERDDVRELSDLAFNMRDYNRAMIELLREMQDTMLETTHEMETIRARFARMK